MRAARWAVVFALGVSAAPATALAKPRAAQATPGEDDKARALVLFEKGAQAYREGRFQDSVDLLLEARALHKAPVLLYDLARAYEGLGRPGDAADAYAGYLAEEAQAADRGAIDARIATLRAQAAELARAKEPPRPPPPVEPAPREAPPSPVVIAAPWVVTGIGLAGIGAGVGLGLAARAAHDDAVAEPVQASARDRQDAAESLATGSTIALVAGGAVVAVGLAWLGVRAFSSSGRAATVALGPTSIGVSGVFW